MNYKTLYNQGINYDQFVESDTKELKEKALKRLYSCEVKEEQAMKIKEAPKAYVLAFMEVYCPDCMVTAPILKKMNEINCFIEYRIVPRKGNEEYMKEFLDENHKPKIPTFVIFDENFRMKGFYIELPKKIKEKIRTEKLNKEEAIRNYRFGKFNDEVFEELLHIIFA